MTEIDDKSKYIDKTREKVKDPKRTFELPNVKKVPPDLSNATPEGLVDELGRVRRIMSRFKAYEGFLKEGLKARWPKTEDPNKEMIMGEDGEPRIKMVPVTSVRGEIYGAEWSEVTQNRVDMDAIREHYGDKEIPTKPNTFVSIRSNGSEDLEEFVIDVNLDDI